MVEAQDENPYVGPRPFERNDRQRFFGRIVELRELVSLVISHRVVLLYAPSGAGKTSLLNAALIPFLERQEQFEVFPSARIQSLEAPPPDVNPYVYGIIDNWSRMLRGPMSGERMGRSLSACLATAEHPLDANGFARPRLLVFDQFEEVFTLYPDRWRERRPFFEQLATAVEDDPLLRTVIALREDYVAELDPYASTVPGSLRTRFRLERLGRQAALSAVTEPAARTSRSYAPGAGELLVDDLLKMRVDTGRDKSVEVEGQFVEPVQLQVVCHSLWSTLPSEVEEITAEHLELFGDVDEVLSRFYSDAVAAAYVASGTPEREIRTKLERMFITPIGTRGIVYAGSTETGGIPNRAIEELERYHLLRGDYRAGTRWLELTHDRLIEPIRASNRERAAAAQARRVRKLTRAAIVLAIALAASLGIWLWTIRSGTEKLVETSQDHGLRTTVLLRVAIDPRGAGRVISSRSRQGERINCGSRCVARFDQGENIRLAAVAAGGSFVRWRGGSPYCISKPTCIYPAFRLTSITAVFAPPIE